MSLQLWQALFSGVSLGSIYALVGLGFFVVYRTSRVLNFAQGEFVMLGGMFAVTFYEAGLELLPAIVLAVAIVVAASVLVQKLLIRPGAQHPVMTLILLSVGVSIIIRGVALLAWGWQVRSMPPFLDSQPLHLFGATIFGQAPWVVGTAALMVGGLYLFYERTLPGKALRACAEQPLGACLQGISVEKMVLYSFILAALLAAAAGAVMTPLTTSNYEIGLTFTIKGLLAAFAGGISRPQGVVAGGLLLGIIEALAAVFVSSGMKEAVAMAVFLGVLIVRPRGLFAGATD